MPDLILMRHAKSAWDDPDLADLDRPLARRGRLAAPLMAAWLAETGLAPDQVILSPARRTAGTWERMQPLLPPAPAIIAETYMAPPDQMLAELRRAKGTRVLFLNHQPGLSALARKLDPAPEPATRRALEDFPTAACLHLEVPDWPSLAFGSGKMRAFAAPKDLV